ncbi:MAG: hypothetical protein ABH869_05580 [Candidatus Omnitrophota bacterium]
MKRKNNSKIHKDHKGEFIYETYFINGKMKKQKIYVVEGIPAEEFYRKNADTITLIQNGDYDLLHEHEKNN